jgi:hypothetical protein
VRIEKEMREERAEKKFLQRSSEGIGRRFVAQAKAVFKLVSRIDVDCEDRAKDFLFHGLELGVGGQDNRGVNEVSNTVVAYSRRKKKKPTVLGQEGGILLKGIYIFLQK